MFMPFHAWPGIDNCLNGCFSDGEDIQDRDPESVQVYSTEKGGWLGKSP